MYLIKLQKQRKKNQTNLDPLHQQSMSHIIVQIQDYLGMYRSILSKKDCQLGRINFPQEGTRCTNRKQRGRVNIDIKYSETPSKGNLLQEIPHTPKILGSSGRVSSKFCVNMPWVSQETQFFIGMHNIFNNSKNT
jgi:hypothetical protein